MAWRGIAIGLIISAPMGPVGMLCIQRTLDKGRKAGLYTGIGAAISDLFYCLLTGFGLSFIEEFLERNSNIIQLIGSAVLIAFAVYLFKKNPAIQLKRPINREVSAKKNILGGFLFTFSNPLILFLIIGLFARFNFLLPEIHVLQYFIGFIFIFVGALLWWWFITFSVDKVRSHFNIRSMWLINRIIGIIILIFAIVGIITATSALCKSQRVSHQCWNQQRGFGSFTENPSPAALDSVTGIAENSGDRILRFHTPASDEFDLRFKIENLHNNPNSKYSYSTSEGQLRKVSSPPWGLSLVDTRGETTDIVIKSGEKEDMLASSPVLYLEILQNDELLDRITLSDRSSSVAGKVSSGTADLDISQSENFYRLSLKEGSLRLYGGHHRPGLLADLPVGDASIDKVGFLLYPASRIRLKEMSLSSVEKLPVSEDLPWNDSEALQTRLELSHDPMEGYWQILDFSVEENLLRLGGDYRFAMVKVPSGYHLIYLSGAKTNSNEWLPGMVKAILSPSGIDGIWDVEWTDAMHSPLSNGLKAQMDINGTLTIQFPYQNSHIRLHPTSNLR